MTKKEQIKKARGKGPLHTTLALDVLMRLTHMNRISTKMEVQEFLFRLAFRMNLSTIIRQTGENDFLALYSYRKRKYKFTTRELEKYIGYEWTDAKESFYHREDYVKGMFINEFAAMMVAGSYGIGLSVPKEFTRETESGTQILSPENTPQNVKAAEIIAAKLMKQIPASAFSGKNWEFLEREMSYKPFEDYTPQKRLPRPSATEYEKRKEYETKLHNNWLDKLNDEYMDFINSFDWDTDVIRRKGKHGLKNPLGEIILPPIFENLKLLSARRGKAGELKKGGWVVACMDGKWGVAVADGKGTWIVKPEYDYIGYPNDITFFQKDDKWSIMKVSTGEFLVKDCEEVPSWNGFMFMNRVATYKKDGKWGVMMDWGAMTEPIFDGVGGDTDDGPVEVIYNGINGYINKENAFTMDEDEGYYRYYLE
ncbi:MAG: WG repeat-containing protein [Bacteroidales bacterium]|nr:WG repeat-containing protein [Bacteroidales bacterium]